MRHYGIIGYPLEHSFSAKFFNERFAAAGIDAEYSLYPLQSLNALQMQELMQTLDGFNVTFPYKETVIPYLDRLDETAQQIGAVNVVHQRIGYNTDCLGFMHSIRPILRPYDRQALVLGTGGAAKAVCYGLKQLSIRTTSVSRTSKDGCIGYADLDRAVMEAHTIVVNCTPLGMLPNSDSYPDIPYQWLSARHLLYDCVYNPEMTVFLQKGKAQGAAIKNGKEMLTGQAKEAWKIWNII